MLALDYVCFNSYNGYSASARNNILALEHNGNYDIKITPLDGMPFKGVEQSYLLQEMINKSNDNSQIQIFHVIPDMQTRVRKKMFSAGFGIFETVNPPERWFSILNKNNIILCPSKFTQSIFSKCDKEVFYVPHCIDFNLFNRDVKTNKSDKFTFLFFGSWRERKGYKTLLDSFYEEFTKDDKVRLVIKTDKAQIAQNVVNLYNKKYKFAPEVKVENDIIRDAELPSFIKSCDCLVAPHIGEGFLIPGLMAMAVGIPTIITEYGGCTDYVSDFSSITLKPEGFIKHSCLDNIPQFANCKWAYVSTNQLRRKMRNIYDKPESYKRMIDLAYNYVINNFSYHNTSEAFNKALERLEVKVKNFSLSF